MLTELLLSSALCSRLRQGTEGCLAFIWCRFRLISGRRLLHSIKERCITIQCSDVSVPQWRSLRRCLLTVYNTGESFLWSARITPAHWSWSRKRRPAKFGSFFLFVLQPELYILGYSKVSPQRISCCCIKTSLLTMENQLSFALKRERHLWHLGKKVRGNWQLNPPSSQWQGSFHEHLVAVMRLTSRHIPWKGIAVLQQAEHFDGWNPSCGEWLSPHSCGKLWWAASTDNQYVVWKGSWNQVWFRTVSHRIASWQPAQVPLTVCCWCEKEKVGCVFSLRAFHSQNLWNYQFTTFSSSSKPTRKEQNGRWLWLWKHTSIKRADEDL